MIRVAVHRRFSDLDPLGHVNNVAFHDYLQEARMGLIADLDGVVNRDFSQIVVEQQIRHRRPLAHSREPVQVDVWLTRLAGSAYTIEYRIMDEHGDVAAEATTVMALVSTADGSPTRIPAHVRAGLKVHLVG